MVANEKVSQADLNPDGPQAFGLGGPLNLLSGGADLDRPISVRTIVQLRWLALVGQGVSITIVYFRAGFQWPLALALAVLLGSALLNLYLFRQVQTGKRQWLSDAEAARFLSFDVLQLGFLLWLTGGLMNPFILLLLAPVSVSASILSKPSTAVLSFLAVVVVTVIAVWSPALPWRSGILRFPPTYLMAVWASMVISILFIAVFVQWVAEQARKLSNALLASQMALEREQRLSALGGLAAAAAHELGTPLSTIAVIAKELTLELPEGSAAREDAEVLQQETLRCREILQKLQTTPDSDPGDPFRLVPITTLIEIAAQPFANEHKSLTILADPFFDPDDETAEQNEEDGDDDIDLANLDLETLDLGQGAFDQPTLPRSPEIIYGVGNLLQNALQFAENEVVVLASWDDQQIKITIEDDGPGFDPSVLPRLGEAYVGRGRGGNSHQARENYTGLGLGVFIAKTLLNHSGAKVTFDNCKTGGAQIQLQWSRGQNVA